MHISHHQNKKYQNELPTKLLHGGGTETKHQDLGNTEKTVQDEKQQDRQEDFGY